MFTVNITKKQVEQARKELGLTHDFSKKYSLSTEGYYFSYRNDKYDNQLVRATLYGTKDNIRVDDVRVNNRDELKDLTHTGVIDYFEARLLLNLINKIF